MKYYTYKYSIIIPHFNDENGLEKLLSTIPKRSDIQVIVVDDRSFSESFKSIVTASGLSNIISFVNDRVKSAGACRNIGLENARGEFLIFYSDSDDYFTENAFKYFDTAISDDESADVFYFKVSSSNEDGSSAKRHFTVNNLVDGYLNNKSEVNETRLRLAYHVPWGRVIKARNVFDNHIKFDETIV